MVGKYNKKIKKGADEGQWNRMGLDGHAQSLNSVPGKALMSSEAKLFHFPVFPHTGARPAPPRCSAGKVFEV